MKYLVYKNRRQFLLGAGGAALAMPLLPSILRPSSAQAAQAASKCFAYFQLPHGAVLQSAMFPADSMLTETKSYAGFDIRRGMLPPTGSNGEIRLSDVLRAPNTLLTPGLLAKMNVLRGIDVPHYIGHGSGQALGNFADMTGGAIDEGRDWKRPTVDQVIAWSPSFYANSPVERSLVVGPISWSYSNPTARSGTVQRVSSTAPSNVALFDKLFGMQAPTQPGGAPPPPDTLLVDKVVESYRRLLGSGKLSAADRRRVDEHMQRLFELQKKMAQPAALPAGSVGPRPTATTGKIDSASTNALTQVKNWGLWTDVAAAAFSVGASRVFTAYTEFETFTNYTKAWHDLAHSSTAARGALFTEANQRFFQSVFLDFARKLDAIAMGDGTTLLDSALIAWSHESGALSHGGIGSPVITFGSAGGFLKTGQYCDYRNLNKVIAATIDADTRQHGLVVHQWLGTALQAMGVPKTDYAGHAGGAGYPFGRPSDFKFLQGNADEPPMRYRYPGTEAAYPDSVWAMTGEVLPWLR